MADQTTEQKTEIKLFSADLDGTLIGKPDGTLAFRRTWDNLENPPILLYNSGRMLRDTLDLIRHQILPTPDYLICGVGTTIYDYRRRTVMKEFTDTLTVGWDRKKIEEVVSRYQDIEQQPKKFQDRFKSSWYLYNADLDRIRELWNELEEKGLKVNVEYSSSRDLDILPEYANKGNSLEWLLEQLNIPPEQALVAGDTGNDISMFHLSGVRGIVVENAQPELFGATVEFPTFEATRPNADGVLEGLLHYGVIDSIADISGESLEESSYDPAIQHVLKTSKFKSLSQEELDFVETAYQKAYEVLRLCITPIGFSACSLEHNTFHHTDQNYKSVWARDGSITIMGSLSVEDPEIRSCQQRTLVTLLTHTSPHGLVPSNVSIETETPDYSGIGGIASVDSGMWVVVAFYHFIRTTRDYQLLRTWYPVLKKIIERISALDANNDSLIEVPEAGDWMDLFGRSYNVLYDEVIWYSANLSFGRICELIGDYKKAFEYLRKAQSIKDMILAKFWPSINTEVPSYSFADQQFSVGDTSYLLAEITPFSFDWRCDVYGNILAGLFNVLDLDRALTAFRFMWGVGVNDPSPVVNLYPPVNAGDPGWRTYYTVNLLNLPYHYHNGGIWPFIGAQWVRFISKLGLRDIAQRELYRLARLNQTGVTGEWEFNEWVHGQTGRPMGKSYQAWSAAGFIHAYHDLQLDSSADGGAEDTPHGQQEGAAE